MREPPYYIGSNRTGWSFVYSTHGKFFESPVNWYAQKSVWDMTPAYQDAREIPLNLPAVPDCLTCHSTKMKPSAVGTENRYRVLCDCARQRNLPTLPTVRPGLTPREGAIALTRRHASAERRDAI